MVHAASRRSRRVSPLVGALALVAAGFGLRPTSAHADAWENVPTGSRTAAMGGAGLAGGSDSAMPLLNPAGLALIPRSIASLSASLYQISSISVPGFIADADTVGGPYGELQLSQRGVRSTEFGSFPSGIAYFLHLGGEDPQVVSLSLSVPHNVRRRFLMNAEFLGDGVSVKDNLTTLIEEQSYVAALSWGGGFGRLRVGASVLGGYTQLIRATDRSILIALGTFGFQRTQVKEARAIDSFELGALAGAQLDVTDWLQLGLSVRAPSLHLGGSFTGSVDLTQAASDGPPGVTTVQLDGDGRRGMPLRVGLGLQLHGERWALALDGVLYLPRERERSADGSQVISDIGGTGRDGADAERAFELVEATRTVVDVRLGFEYRVSEEHWLRTGVFTEFAAGVSTETTLGGERGMVAPEAYFVFPVSRVGASLGWGTRLGPIDTTFGVRATYGSGQTLRPVPDARLAAGGRLAEATDATVADALAFLSAAVDVTEGAAALMDAVGGSSGPTTP